MRRSAPFERPAGSQSGRVAIPRSRRLQDPERRRPPSHFSIALSPLVVNIPVLLIYGDHDPFLPGGFEIQPARYASSDDVTLEVLANAGHNAMMGRTAAEYRAVMSSWLKARGF